MTDLYLQVRILYYLYESHNKGLVPMSLQDLRAKENLQYVEPIPLRNELDFLKGKGYVESTEEQRWKISANGIEKTESVYTNFVEFIETYQIEHWSDWVNNFNAFSSKSERIDEIFFKIHKETVLRNAFQEYLNSKEFRNIYS